MSTHSSGKLLFSMELIEYRYDSASKYIAYLESTKSFSAEMWFEEFLTFQKSLSPLWLGMALIHPRWYNQRISQSSICGPRRFSIGVSVSTACDSRALWGYQCQSAVSAEIDHVFPYSLGGPTDIDNAKYLCSLHNQMKGQDIHVYPWELEPVWLGRHLAKIKDHLRAFNSN